MLARRLVLVCLALGVFLAGMAVPALAVRGHEFAGSFGWGVLNGAPELQTCTTKCLKGLEGTGPGEFHEPVAAAINEATGVVYVVDQGNRRIEWFKPKLNTKKEVEAYELGGQFNGSGEYEIEGKLEKGTAAGSGGKPGETETGQFAKADPAEEEVISIAIDNDPTSPSFGDVYVVDDAHHVVDKFTPEGAYINQLTGVVFTGQLSKIGGVGVDTQGQVFVATDAGVIFRYSNAEVNELSGAVGATLAHFDAPGFAVDAGDDLYLTGREQSVFEVGPEGCRGPGRECEHGEFEVVDSGVSSGVGVESLSGDVYVDEVGSVVRFPPRGGTREALESLVVPGGGGAGVAVSSESARVPGQVLVPVGSGGMVDVFDLVPPGTPVIAGEAASEVTGESARLEGTVNPRSESFEAATSYCFQYVSEEQFAREGFAGSGCVPQPAGVLAANYEADPVGVVVQGLAPHTAYRFRLVASNSHGLSEGELGGQGGETAHTFTTQATGGGLLDGRGWELVSSPDKRGANLLSDTFAGAIQAAADGAAITYLANAPTEAGPEGYANETQVLSARSHGGWVSRDITPPHQQPTGAHFGSGEEYRFFSSDLSLGVLQPWGLFDSLLSPRASEQTAYLRTDFLGGNRETPCLPAHMQCYMPLVTSENATSGKPFGLGESCAGFSGPCFLGATADLSHIVLRSETGLSEGEGAGGGLYEWSAGQLAFAGHGQLGSGESVRNAISNDGARIFVSEFSHLFLRDMSTGQTLELDRPEPGCVPCAGGSAAPEFQIASSDGSRVYFTDTQRLTAGSGAAVGRPDLYECEVREEAGELACVLSDVTPGGNVPGSVIGASQDGSWVYFTASGVLTATPNARGETALPGDCTGMGTGITPPARATCNLYVSHAGTISLVAVLSARDEPDVHGFVGLSGLMGRVSPDGQWLAFMSQRSLTGYDNRDTKSGQPDEEVFVYDAHAAAGGAGEVFCASCDPTGARPHGSEYKRIGKLAQGAKVWEEDQWLAASLPGWDAQGLEAHTYYQPRYISDSGRLFFNSDDALVPQDVNGTWDVYEYEPPHVGSCETTSTTYTQASQGCIALISSGESPQESVFLDASETGSDAFFLTTARLAAEDHDTAVDVYDAHECTPSTPCPTPPPQQPEACVTLEGCRTAPTPQPEIFGAPPSALFNGTGNPTQTPTQHPPAKCKKGYTRKHGKCIKNKTKKHNKKKGGKHGK